MSTKQDEVKPRDRHGYEPLEGDVGTWCGYTPEGGRTCGMNASSTVNILEKQSPLKSIETLAGELATVIVNADKVKYYDTRLQSDERIKRLLIEFAEEVKRSAIEP